MKVFIFLGALFLLELTTHIHCHCDFFEFDWIHCENVTDNYLAYSQEYENVTFVTLNGNFTEFGFDSKFYKLSNVVLNSESLVKFKMDHLKNLTSLEIVEIMSDNDKTIDLNLNN